MLSPKRHLPYWLISITVAALYQLIIRPIYDRWPYVVALFGLIITLFIREVTPPLKRLSPYYGAVAILVLSLGEASSAIARVCSTISTAAGQESVFRLFTLHARLVFVLLAEMEYWNNNVVPFPSLPFPLY